MSFSFFSLPTGVQWVILNKLSFADLMRVCSINKMIFDMILSPEYVQQRLLNLDISFDFQRTILNFGPRIGYVKILADSRKVYKDPDVLLYMSKSERLLFPGIEYYIGLATAGVRAVNMSDPDMLTHVLKMYPNKFEQDDIIGSLYMSSHTSKESLLDESITKSLFEISRTTLFTSDMKFIPRSSLEYEVYHAATSGMKRIEVDGEHLTADIYIYGLVDGGHDDLFITGINDYYPFYMEKYVAANGTPSMIEALLKKDDFNLLYSDDLITAAVDANNLNTARVLLNQHYELKDEVYPRSKEMVNLLRLNGVEISDEQILVGAMLSGNYDLFNIDLANLESSKITNALTCAPGFMIQKYLDNNPLSNGAYHDLVCLYAANHDLYRTEILLTYDFDLTEYQRDNLKRLCLNKLCDVFHLPASRFPLLDSVVSRQYS